MDRSISFKLLTSTKWQDEIKQWHETTRKREVFGQLGSVTANEFFAGGQNGFKPEFRIVMFAPDYLGEELLEIDGQVYSIYRTYFAKNDMIELYVEKRSGNETGRSQQSSPK